MEMTKRNDQEERLRKGWVELQRRDNYLDSWERDLRQREDQLNFKKSNRFHKKSKKQNKEKNYAAMAAEPVDSKDKLL